MIKMQLIIPTHLCHHWQLVRMKWKDPISSVSCVCLLPTISSPSHTQHFFTWPARYSTQYYQARHNIVHGLLFYVICICAYLFCYSMCSPIIYSDRQLSQHCQLGTLSGESECKFEGQNHEVLAHDRTLKKIWHV